MKAFICAASLLYLSGCTTNAGQLGEPGTLHAGEVVQVLTRSEILGSRGIHESLGKAGVADSTIQDGSVVVIRTLCCGPPNTSNPHGAYNAKSLPIQTVDVVEFLWPGGSAVNSVTRVLQPSSQADGDCWWDPKDDVLWRRVMFCNWMPQQGWVKQEWHMVIGWYKPAEHP